MQGANTMAKALADIRLVFSCRAILRKQKQNKTEHPSEIRIQMENSKEVCRRDERKKMNDIKCIVLKDIRNS